MVYSGLELGQYFELKSGDDINGCNNVRTHKRPDALCDSDVCFQIFMLLTPLARMILSIAQMQFICENFLKLFKSSKFKLLIFISVLNTTEMDMGKHKVIARFGLMHMVATNLCEWLYTLVEETKHEIWHLDHSAHEAELGHNTHEQLVASTYSTEDVANNLTMSLSSLNATDATHNLLKRSIVGASQKYQDCQRTNIMGSLVQNASPFLFPCTIEYSLICAVILFEMWKKVRSIPEINRTRKNSLKPGPGHQVKSAYHFSIDCSKAHRGMFAGIVVIVMTIICLIMYFVLHEQPDYVQLAIKEVTYYEIILYTVCASAVLMAFIRMRDLKFQKKTNGEKMEKFWKRYPTVQF